MQIVELIQKKKMGLELTAAELHFIVDGYTKGIIPDYQMSAFLMAVCFKGMTDKETVKFTMEMADSGEKLDLSEIKGIKVDKHSTGGIGDKTTLIVGPILAALGVPVAKMSGRGLGTTGGTIDKLESIPGFSSDISNERFINQVKTVGFVDAGQTKNLAPADKKIYALRDVTGTVDSIPLIASSIMSKKIAAGADAIVLDVKCGTGAFMQNMHDAKKLAETMIKIGNGVGKKVTAVISDMNEPLGRTVGNAIEVREAIECLKGNMESRLKEVVYAIAEQMLILYEGGFSHMSGENEKLIKAADKRIDNVINDGTAIKKFREFVSAQGGNPIVADEPEILPEATVCFEVKSNDSGYLYSCDAEKVGRASAILGAGRISIDDKIDYSAGIKILKKIGDYVHSGDVIAVLYTNRCETIKGAYDEIMNAYNISADRPEKKNVIYDIIL